MDFGGVVFFGFLAAIIIVPQVLRYKDRERLHQTLRIAFERGQPVPPELIAALQWGRRRSYNPDYDFPPEVAAAWQPRATPPGPMPPDATAPASAVPPGDPASAAVMPPPVMAPMFINQHRRDFRRGLIWLAVGLGLVACGAAFYAGLYDVGGAPETFASFAAMGAVPSFVGLTYLALAWFGREKAKS